MLYHQNYNKIQVSILLASVYGIFPFASGKKMPWDGKSTNICTSYSEQSGTDFGEGNLLPFASPIRTAKTERFDGEVPLAKRDGAFCVLLLVFLKSFELRGQTEMTHACI